MHLSSWDTPSGTLPWPPLPRDFVDRPRLREFGRQLARPGLTLVVAPAGYGKSTLLSAWAREAGETGGPAAWLTLDERHRDPEQFIRDLVAAVRAGHPGFGEATLAAMRDGFDAPLAIRRFSSDLRSLPGPLLLMLDDYHLGASGVSTTMLTRLMLLKRPGLHIVLASRTAPRMGPVTSRPGGAVTEIGPDDLRFSREEAGALLHPQGAAAAANPDGGREPGLDLETLTGGAPARLRLYALAAPALQAPALRELDPSDRDAVLDRLTTAALARLDGEECDRLARLAVPTRFDLPLAARLLALPEPDVRALLERFAAATGLLAADPDGSWRFHSVIRDALLARLAATAGKDGELALQRELAAIMAERGDLLAAIDRYRAIGDDAAAVSLAERHVFLPPYGQRPPDVERWLRRLPRNRVIASPRLLLAKAAVAGYRGDAPEAERMLAAARFRLDRARPRPSAADSAWLAAAADIIHCYSLGDAPDREAAIATLREAISALGERESWVYGSGVVALANLLHRAGRPGEATELFDEAMPAPDAPPSAIASRLELARALTLLDGGRPAAAGEAAARAAAIADAMDLAPAAIEARLWQGVAAVQCLDFAAAEPLLRDALARRSEVSVFSDREGTIALALLLHVSGRADEADELTERAAAQASRSQDAGWWSLALSLRSRLGALQGDRAAMRIWLDRYEALGLPGIAPMMEHPGVTRLQAGLAGRGVAVDRAREAIPALVAELDAAGDTLNAIRARLLQALAVEPGKRWSDAARPLRDAIRLARETGILLPFAELWRPLASDVPRVSLDGQAIADAVAAAIPEGPAGGVAAHILTKRERQFLHLIAEGLTNRQIGDRLGIAEPTVKRHSVALYQKLGVYDRRQAVEVARKSGFLDE